MTSNLMAGVPPLAERVVAYKKQVREADEQRKQQLRQKEEEDNTPSSPNNIKKKVSFDDPNLKKDLREIFDNEKMEERPRQVMSGWNWNENLTSEVSPSTSPKSLSKGRFQIKYTDDDNNDKKKIDKQAIAGESKIDSKLNTDFDPFHGDDFTTTPVLIPRQAVPTDIKPIAPTQQQQQQQSTTGTPTQSSNQQQQPQQQTPQPKVATQLNTQRPLSPTQSSVTTPSNTSPIVTGPKRHFKVKDVEEEELPPPRVPTSADFSGLPRSTSNSNLNGPVQEPTLSSLAKQLNELTIANQQTYKVLNMVYNMALQQQKSHQNLSSQNAEVVEISQLVLRLQERVDGVLVENTQLKQENENMKGELQLLKKQIQAREEKTL
jgi:hypothetical protein